MVFEVPASSENEEEVEMIHDELATEHSAENVFVTEDGSGDVISIVGDGVGDINPESVTIHPGSELEVPSITVTEPVLVGEDGQETVWVTCELEWDPHREQFINPDADPEWIIDDHAFADSEYRVGEIEHPSLHRAMEVALYGTKWEGEAPCTVHIPESGETRFESAV